MRADPPQAKTSSALAELSGIGLRILLQILLRDAKFDLFERNKKKIEEEVVVLLLYSLDSSQKKCKKKLFGCGKGGNTDSTKVHP